MITPNEEIFNKWTIQLHNGERFQSHFFGSRYIPKKTHAGKDCDGSVHVNNLILANFVSFLWSIADLCEAFDVKAGGSIGF